MGNTQYRKTPCSLIRSEVVFSGDSVRGQGQGHQSRPGKLYGHGRLGLCSEETRKTGRLFRNPGAPSRRPSARESPTGYVCPKICIKGDHIPHALAKTEFHVHVEIGSIQYSSEILRACHTVVLEVLDLGPRLQPTELESQGLVRRIGNAKHDQAYSWSE